MPTSSASLSSLESALLKDIAAASDLAALEAVRIASLGKKGSISAEMAKLGGLAPDQTQLAGLWHCLRNGQVFGAGTGRYEVQDGLYLPLRARQGRQGSAVLHLPQTSVPAGALVASLQAICDQFGLALERAEVLRREAASRSAAELQGLRAQDGWGLLWPLQLGFYGVAALGALLNLVRLNWTLTYVPFYFVAMNLAAAAGILRFARGTQSPLWDKARR